MKHALILFAVTFIIARFAVGPMIFWAGDVVRDVLDKD